MRPPVSGGSIVDDDREMEKNVQGNVSFDRRVDVRSEIQNAVDQSVLDVSESNPSSPRGGARGREFRLRKVSAEQYRRRTAYHEARDQSIENSQLEKRLESVSENYRTVVHFVRLSLLVLCIILKARTEMSR